MIRNLAAVLAFVLGLLVFASSDAPAVPTAEKLSDAQGDLRIYLAGETASAWPGGIGAFANRPYEVFQGRGVVGNLDPDGPRVVIEGFVYRFAVDAQVRLRSGFGAPTLLAPGMTLEFYYREVDDAAGSIIAAIEIQPDPSIAR